MCLGEVLILAFTIFSVIAFERGRSGTRKKQITPVTPHAFYFIFVIFICDIRQDLKSHLDLKCDNNATKQKLNKERISHLNL